MQPYDGQLCTRRQQAHLQPDCRYDDGLPAGHGRGAGVLCRAAQGRDLAHRRRDAGAVRRGGRVRRGVRVAIPELDAVAGAMAARSNALNPRLRAPFVVLALVLVAGLVACDRAPEPTTEKSAGAKPAPSDTEPAAAAAPAAVGTWTDDFDGMKDRRLVRMLVVYSKTFYFIDKATQR